MSERLQFNRKILQISRFLQGLNQGLNTTSCVRLLIAPNKKTVYVNNTYNNITFNIQISMDFKREQFYNYCILGYHYMY